MHNYNIPTLFILVLIQLSLVAPLVPPLRNVEPLR